MKTCTECDWSYPDDLVQPMCIHTSEFSGYVDVCAICGLKISNDVHGMDRKAFNGEIAESLRQQAIAFRKAHPEKEPTP